MHLPFHRSLAVNLALAAMVLRALLPDGWMPSTGAAPFTICSADIVKQDGKAPPAQEHSHAPCAFAAAAPLAPSSSVAIALTAPSQASRVASPLLDVRLSPSSPYRPNAARGPPDFS